MDVPVAALGLSACRQFVARARFHRHVAGAVLGGWALLLSVVSAGTWLVGGRSRWIGAGRGCLLPSVVGGRLR